MNPPEFSVLLLAWDDADPDVAIMGGAALPATQTLVYQLATQHPVLALYPHLPAADAAPASPVAPARPAAETSPSTVPAAVAPGPLETAVAMPGVRLLPEVPAAAPLLPAPAPPRRSRIVGLADLMAAPLPPRPADAPGPVAPSGNATPTAATVPVPPAGRSQWPTGVNAPVPNQGRRVARPAAPYLGASGPESFPPPPPAPPRRVSVAPTVAPALPAPVPATATTYSATGLRPDRPPQDGDLRFGPDPEMPVRPQPAGFGEEMEGIGPAEANDLSAPEDDLLLGTPAAETPHASVPAEPAPAPAARATGTAKKPAAAAPVVPLPALENLNFRMIEYARRAAQLMQGRSDFGVIYAPNWPAWLAALEIRNSSRLPLVLYAATLAADFAGPAERGWLLEVERMTLRRAHLVLVPDPAAKHRLHARYGDLPGEVRVVAAHDEAGVQSALNAIARPR